MNELLEEVLDGSVVLKELKSRPGRRRVFRATAGPRSAIVKHYASDRAPVVAARLRALAAGPPEVRVPQVLALDVERHVLVLSEVPGLPLREPLLSGDARACAFAGAALGAWHHHFLGVAPHGLRPHPPERELEILRARADAAPAPLGRAVRRAATHLVPRWECVTAVHRDLYEEQVLLHERAGLIDLDDAALGPPELDLGNLAAHTELLAMRVRRSLRPAFGALMRGYEQNGPPLDRELLETCRALSLLRLACIHRRPELIGLAMAPALASAPSRGAA